MYTYPHLQIAYQFFKIYTNPTVTALVYPIKVFVTGSHLTRTT